MSRGGTAPAFFLTANGPETTEPPGGTSYGYCVAVCGGRGIGQPEVLDRG
jgi:hypothetical protein